MTSSGFDFLWECMNPEERGWLLSRTEHGATGDGVAADLKAKGIPLSFQIQEPNPGELFQALLEHRAGSREKDSPQRI